MLGINLLNHIGKYHLAFFMLATNYIFAQENATAQIVSDGTLDSEVQLINQTNIITGGQEVGTNLFHSFKEFSPVPDAVTYFNNNPNIENIFTRVTGGIPSVIDGVIETNNASLFLINPSGIIFRNNAKLNINGSFFATTAEQVIFADGTTFNTQVSNVKPLLTVSLPIGVQYGTSPGTIVSSNNSDEPPPIYEPLTPGNTFALLGGEVTLNNTVINSSSGRVEIAAVGKEETIELQKNSNGNWDFDYSDVTNFKNISIGQQSEIDSLRTPAIMNLRGDNIIINSSDIINSNTTEQNGGTISLTATNSIQVNRGILATQLGFLQLDGPLIPSTGKGGDISLNAREIILTNGSVVSASTLSEGAGGNINIQAKEYLEISDVRNSISPSGDINILPSLIAVTVLSSGSGGNIKIETDRLNLTDGGRIDSSTFGIGNAGTIEINARDSITISGKGGNFNSGLYASSGNENVNNITGESGSLLINTSQLLLQEGGQISVENLGQKDAGNIAIFGEEIILEGNSKITANTNSGNGGSIALSSNLMILQDQSSISVEARGNGDGGNILINTENLVLFDESTITANAEAGKGGNIVINTKGLFAVDPINQIDASSDVGIDGEITITDPDVYSKINTNLQERSPISPEKFVYSGCGLNSDFTANRFHYVGRGGISPSPLTVITEDIVGELGTVEYIQKTTKTEPNKTLMSPIVPEIKNNSLQEATTWIVNDRGNVELVAQSPNVPMIASECPIDN